MSHNKMLIDATHPEETRVVVLRDGRVEEFDYESAARKLLRGNIYLAKVTRVEPSLQAAFVDYGGNRHGFLAFSEIHPDYYQIPLADRQALLDAEAAEEAEEERRVDARAEAAEAHGRSNRPRRGSHRDEERDPEDTALDVTPLLPPEHPVDGDGDGVEAMAPQDAGDGVAAEAPASTIALDGDRGSVISESAMVSGASEPVAAVVVPHAERVGQRANEHGSDTADNDVRAGESNVVEVVPDEAETAEGGAPAEPEQVDTAGAEDALEELPSRPRRRARSYKIQEVIKRRQIILIQVVKEERGTKGAALTTYLSLAGRYTVLMPNTARGGGISRKITNAIDRKRLKAIADELEVPEGMGLIIRTAGAARTKQEIKRDFEYLLRLWESVRDMTLQSVAPSLVYEEGDLIKRSIRDLYTKEIEEIVVAGDHAHKEAHDFMQMLMPSHVKNVIRYKDPEPLFARYQIERQLNAMFSPYVHLRSGGYLVINQTEALVSIDVNSGKSTREYSIEETALNTNLEASDEIARQLKLRDLAGLIVIDFIDMEEKRNNRAVERKIKDALRFDRARIQVGRISHFGLLEMSRQRMRTGVLEGSTTQCPHCQGTGIIRSIESVALAVLRGLEDAVTAGSNAPLIATTTAPVALYLLNNKRQFIIDMETRLGLPVTVLASDKVQGANFTVERGARTAEVRRPAGRAAVSMDWGFNGEAEDAIETAPSGGTGGNLIEVDEPDVADEPLERGARDDQGERGEGAGDRDGGKRRRRRRGRRGEPMANGNGNGNGNGRDQRPGPSGDAGDERPAAFQNTVEVIDDEESPGVIEPRDDAGDETGGPRRGDAAGGGDRERRGRRRGRRGGRRGRDRDQIPIGEGRVAGNDDEPMTNGGGAYAGEPPLGGEEPPMDRVPMADAGDARVVGSVDHADADRPMVADAAPAPAPRPKRQWNPPADVPAAEVKPAVVEASPPVEVAPPPVVVEPAPAPAPVAVEPPAPVEPVRTPRTAPVSSEPVLERIVVGDAAATLAEQPKPTKRGWWSKT